jgi:uncharacterized protein
MPSRLENYVELPSSKSPGLLANMGSKLAVICTHPWGPLGGNLHNNVVSAVVLYFQKINVTTLRFDFSGAQFSRGILHVAQVDEAAKYLLALPETPPQYILLIGYSYGSLISASASASISQAIGSISIAPPFSVKHWLLMFHSNFHMRQAQKRTTLPRLLILGTKDNFTAEAAFNRIIETFPPSTTTGALLKDANHFFNRREKDLMDVINQWIMQTYRISSLQALPDMDFPPSGETFDVRLATLEQDVGMVDNYVCAALTGSSCT